jgi:hypothetical protein
MSEYKIIESKEIVWCANDDRYLYIEKEDNEIVGLNFMQGDEIEYFKDHYCEVSKDLTIFYNAVSVYLGGESELDRINQAIWAYVDYRNSLDAVI